MRVSSRAPAQNPEGGNDCHLATRQIGCQPRQSVELTIRPAKFKRHVSVLE